MGINHVIHQFVRYIIKEGPWEEIDQTYLENRVLYFIGVSELKELKEEKIFEGSVLELVDQLVETAITTEHIKNTEYEIECLRGQLMDLMVPSPSKINSQFNKLYEKDPEIATQYFFELSQKTDYIKIRDIAKNIEFPVATEYGDLEITINLSRPEKDPKQIASSINQRSIDYPKCMLCMENEGYAGRNGYPNRFNHRIIRTKLNNESWGFQYSPYAYYNEHAIVFSEKHTPMKIGKQTFERLLSIIEWLPHYFVGSNADLPIVGGSILSHDHYQAGRFTFPIEKNEIEFEFTLPQFKQVKAGIVKWPMSVIRISGEKKEELVEVADFILKKWQIYSDKDLSIVAKTTDGIEHHTITPIARKRNDLFEIDLVLRDNNVSEEFPDGIFHPHQELHHIKKENIGLIEVMGLAILPPRLYREMIEVRKYLLNQKNNIEGYHLKWAEKIKETNEITTANVDDIVNQEIGYVFLKVLQDAGVYKRDTAGMLGFKKFISFLSE
ncbi:UDP-glucose--hexose-1-phosphate uridylyltransferase [Vagococcus fluvialis]|uniref:UDP-glucose--hexose-1-phosphate uridylyltransferase n=1 Tax=Vagococcus fluvialis TaxID=2738 RepID=UPI003D0B58F6